MYCFHCQTRTLVLPDGTCLLCGRPVLAVPETKIKTVPTGSRDGNPEKKEEIER